MNRATKWTEVRIGDVGQIFTGRTPSTECLEYFGDELFFITPRDMHQGKRVLATERKLSNAGGSLLKRIQLPPNSICVSCIGWQMGEVVMTSATSFTNQQINSIVPNSNVDADFIYYSFVPRKQELLSIASAIGVRTPILNKSGFCNLRMILPPLPIQRRIASILSAYDDLIENNSRRIAILEEMARRIYEEWFVHFRFPGHENVKMVDSELGKIPEGWKVIRVGQVLHRLSAGKTYKKDYVQNSGTVMVVDQSDSDFLGFHNTTADHSASVTNPIAIFGDHTCKLKLMVRPFSIGPNTIPFIGANNINTIYIFQLVRGLVKTHEYKRHWTDLLDKKVILCPDELAPAYGEKVQEMIHLVLILTQKNHNLRTTRDFLLPKLISGEIDVSQLPEPEEAAA